MEWACKHLSLSHICTNFLFNNNNNNSHVSATCVFYLIRDSFQGKTAFTLQGICTVCLHACFDWACDFFIVFFINMRIFFEI